MHPACFITLGKTNLEKPTAFTFPFYYDPHPLSLMAAEDLQQRLKTWEIAHDFGYPVANENSLGKMFGVLVVESAGEVGYLAAFSGKIAGKNRHEGFVPPVFDVLEADGFFRKGEEELNALTERISLLKNNPGFSALRVELQKRTEAATRDLFELEKKHRQAKEKRHATRSKLSKLPPEELQNKLRQLSTESQQDHYEMKDRKRYWQQQKEEAEKALYAFYQEIDALEAERASLSAALQQQIFEHYQFLNAHGATANLLDLFKHEASPVPPAGAGECAAPRLLHYAYQHGMKPLAMAEFWWGAPPPGELRQHGHFYPACRGKCGPILAHMLQGLTVEENPLLNRKQAFELEIIYEDAAILAVNKPSGILSVTGRETDDCVTTRLAALRPGEIWIPVHRLDMDTSGVLLFAASTEIYKVLQQQFLKHEVQKQYVAILEGNVTSVEGMIDLPLAPDYINRPRQLVDQLHGKMSKTRYKVLSHQGDETRIAFFPLTGRTHQLRVHAAHPDGLNAPIKGDDLYGKKADRLHLHAEYLYITHPVTAKRIRLRAACPF